MDAETIGNIFALLGGAAVGYGSMMTLFAPGRRKAGFALFSSGAIILTLVALT